MALGGMYQSSHSLVAAHQCARPCVGAAGGPVLATSHRRQARPLTELPRSPDSSAAASRRSGADRCATLPHALRDARRNGPRKLMLPETQYDPAASFEQRRSLQVACLVSTDLRASVIQVGGRHGEVLRASVPAAAVDEHGDSRSSEEQIRRPAEVRPRASAHSIAQPSPVHEPAHGQLGFGVAPAVPQHGLSGGLTGCPRFVHDSTVRRGVKHQAGGSRTERHLCERGEQGFKCRDPVPRFRPVSLRRPVASIMCAQRRSVITTSQYGTATERAETSVQSCCFQG